MDRENISTLDLIVGEDRVGESPVSHAPLDTTNRLHIIPIAIARNASLDATNIKSDKLTASVASAPPVGLDCRVKFMIVFLAVLTVFREDTAQVLGMNRVLPAQRVSTAHRAPPRTVWVIPFAPLGNGDPSMLSNQTPVKNAPPANTKTSPEYSTVKHAPQANTNLTTRNLPVLKSPIVVDGATSNDPPTSVMISMNPTNTSC